MAKKAAKTTRSGGRSAGSGSRGKSSASRSTSAGRASGASKSAPRGKSSSTRRSASASRSSSGSSTAKSSRASASAKSGRASQQSKQKDLGDLFLETLKDVYHAEKQLVRALPKMAKAAQSAELRQAFEKHAQETQVQAERLEKIFELSGKRPQAKPCHGMMGLVEEGNEAMKEFKGSEALDAALIGAAQAVEHYEIARYGTMREWAQQHGMNEVAGLLDQTLAEEKKTDQLLTQLAEASVNPKAE
jgi:ferritin-like metal-binding protein YciE